MFWEVFMLKKIKICLIIMKSRNIIRNMNRTKRNIILFVVMLIISFPAFSKENYVTVNLQLKWVHQFQFAGYYAAVEKGYYEAAGIKVNFIQGKPGIIVSDEVAEGRSEFGIANSQIVVHYLNGKPLVLLASIVQHSPSVYAALKEKNIYTPQDFYNQRIMVRRGIEDAECLALILKEGLSLDDVNIIPNTFDYNDILNGNTDLMHIYKTNELYALQRSGKDIVIIDPINYGIDFYSDCLFTNHNYLKEHPDIVKKFREASLKGWKYAFDNEEEIIHIIKEKYKSNKSVEHLKYEANEMRKLILPDLVEIGHTNEGRWMAIANTYKKLGMISDNGNVNLEKFFYDPQYNKWKSILRIASTIGFAVLLILIIVVPLLLLLNMRLRVVVDKRTKELNKLNNELSEQIEIQKKQKNQLKEREEKFRLLSENAQDLIYRMKIPDGKYEYVSPAVKELTGYSPEEVYNNNLIIKEIIHPDFTNYFKEKWQDLVNGKCDRVYEYKIIDKFGNEKWLSQKNVLIMTGENSYNLESIVRDVTDIKKVQDELHKNQSVLYSIIEQMPAGLLIVDSKTEKILMINDLASKILHVKQEELIDQKMGLFEDLNLKFYHSNGKLWEDSDDIPIIESARNGKVYSNIEISIENAVGEKKQILYNSQPVQNEDGELLGGVMIFSDISNYIKLEAELLNARKLESIGILAGGIAHDFNNILTGITGNVSLALMNIDSEESYDKIKTNLDNINKASKRAADLARQLLTFSRGGAPVKKILDFCKVVQETSSFSLRGSDLSVTFHLPEEKVFIAADEGQISQVVNNLVINAIQALEHSGHIDISISKEKPEMISGKVNDDFEFAVLKVRDDGCGISKEVQKRIFDPYFSTKDTGSGLGLATVYSIIKKHGGFIEIDSEECKYTEFSIFFPLSKETIDDNKDSENRLYKGSGKILVLDDNKSVLTACSSILQAAGYSVSTAENGNAAVNLFKGALEQGNPYNAVVLDLTIPGEESGIEVLKKLRKVDPSIKAIMSSGYSSKAEMKHFSDYGFDDVVQKPYSAEDLTKSIYNLLNV